MVPDKDTRESPAAVVFLAVMAILEKVFGSCPSSDSSQGKVSGPKAATWSLLLTL